jgi:hypothetical protein
MTSKIIVNNIQSDTGVSTVTIASPVALSGGITGTGFAVGTGASISSPATNVLTVSTNNVERIRVGAAGSIGIGTDNPTKLIDMSGVHSGINTTGRFVMSPHASGWDTGVTSGNIHHHYIDNFRLYSGQIGSGTERFKVDSSGRVTKPYQPSFHAVNTTIGQINTDGYGIIIFNDVTNNGNHNIGGHYSTSTGRFTAPIAGRYLICARSLTNSSANSNLYVSIWVRLNTNLIGYLGHNHSDFWIMESYSGILSLSEGDNVDVYVEEASAHGGQTYSSFSGHLLS